MRGRPLLPLGSSCSPDTELIALFALRPLSPRTPPLPPQLLEYVGKGKSIVDVGLAQARRPLSTRSHYFEVEIVDPGEKCYIALGLARKVGGAGRRGGGGGVPLCTPPSTPITQPEGFLSSPRITPKTGTPAGAGDRWRTMRVSAPHCPPPWCFGGMWHMRGVLLCLGGGPCFTRGSATIPPTDDGKIFHGSGVGDPFGPRCYKGDTMGCGIMFPRDYSLDSEGGWGAGRGGVRHRDPPQG